MYRKSGFTAVLVVVFVFSFFLQGTKARSFNLNVQLDGIHANQKSVNLKDYAGKLPMIVVFFYPQCPPCEREVKIINKLYEKYSKRAFIVGVSLSRDRYDIEDFINDNNVKYPVYMIHKKSQLRNIGGILATPTTLLIDKNGRIVKKIVGERKFRKFCKDIEKCFEKKGGAN